MLKKFVYINLCFQNTVCMFPISAADMEQAVCLVHADLHDDHGLTQIEHVATSVIKVQPSSLDSFLIASNILHKWISGKVIGVVSFLDNPVSLRTCSYLFY